MPLSFFSAITAFLVTNLPQSAAVIERGIADQLHFGAQLYVSQGGRVLADEAFGQARPGVPMQRDSVLLWLSSGKPLTAVAVAQLWERGRLQLDDFVGRFIPEFNQLGKETITVRQLLTHTCGIRTAEKCDFGSAWSEIIPCICETPPEAGWVPGQRAAYHPSASWYILGEIVHRIDGRPLELYLRQEVMDVCGLRDTWIALPSEHFHAYGDRLGLIFHTEHRPPTPHRHWNTEADAAVCRPGRNARGPIRELGRFYETLLQLRNGRGTARPLLRPETVRELTRRQRAGMFDDTFQQVVDWGLGFLLDSKRYGREIVSYGYGRDASDETFGHSGAQSSGAFADPVHDLVVAWAFNGMPGARQHRHRAHSLNTAIYADLGLANAGRAND